MSVQNIIAIHPIVVELLCKIACLKIFTFVQDIKTNDQTTMKNNSDIPGPQKMNPNVPFVTTDLSFTATSEQNVTY